MIAIMIMSFLTVLVSMSIRTGVRNKKKLEARIASETELYDALRVIKLDVERAFHYQDVFFAIENLALKQLEQEKDKVGGAPRQPRPPRIPPIQLTQFLGEENSMHFTALNHYRTRYNAPESDQMEVGFFVDSCEKRSGKGSTKCLWRRSNPQIDDKVDQDGAKVIAASNVTQFKLEYRSNKEEDEWVKQWRSDNKGRADHRNRFPHFVKINLEIDDSDNPSAKKISQTIVVRVSFPNNEPHIQQTSNQEQAPQ